MDALNNIKTRRSVRDFQDKMIFDEVLHEIIEYARFAPSWKNSQSVRYIAIKDKRLKENIAHNCVMDFEYNKRTIVNAPVIMIVLTKKKRSGYERDGNFSTSKRTHWESFDAGVATQTLMLAAHALNVSSVTLGIYDEEKLSDELSLENGHKISAIVAMGYSEENVEMPIRKLVEDLLVIK